MKQILPAGLNLPTLSIKVSTYSFFHYHSFFTGLCWHNCNTINGGNFPQNYKQHVTPVQ